MMRTRLRHLSLANWTSTPRIEHQRYQLKPAGLEVPLALKLRNESRDQTASMLGGNIRDGGADGQPSMLAKDREKSARNVEVAFPAAALDRRPLAQVHSR